MAQKRLRVLWTDEWDYVDGGWVYGYKIVSGNETLFYGARTYTTKSNLFRGIRRAMKKLGISQAGENKTWWDNTYRIEEEK